jgi:two-component system cell cycle response regulator
MKWWNSKKTETQPAPAKPLVVMVDDEQEICAIMGIALIAEGFDFASSHDGLSGLSLIRERRPQVAILDIKMPRMNGFQVLAKMQQDPELGQIPVIVMTSITDGSDTSDAEWASKLGVYRFLSKPVEPEALIQAVREQIFGPEEPSSGLSL